jgi:hypothetical protein
MELRKRLFYSRNSSNIPGMLRFIRYQSRKDIAYFRQ